ncbi:MAG TPA: GNAT family N-acetyltransferase [Chitinophagaceae bacterium]|nr:GNAT family N-acetyltransferase [Chitinophagaceae bacterium]
MIAFRSMRSSDIATGLVLCRAAGWNQLARDWEIFLHLSPNDCRVATTNDNVIGTVTTIRYQTFFCWIGMVLVDPDSRGQGIGMQLLHEALHILKNEETIKLDATPAGREIYLKLNFIDEYQISRMSLNSDVKNISATTARLLQEKDIKAIVNFDREIFGADRQDLLVWMLEGAPEIAYVIEDCNEILGYCLGRHGHDFTHIGPIVAREVNIAKELVAAALSNYDVRPLIVDAMHFNKEWLEWLSSIGFIEQRSFIRMYRGKNKFPGVPEKQFAILGPEFG